MQGFEEALKGRSGAQPMEKDLKAIRGSLDREKAEKEVADQVLIENARFSQVLRTEF